MANVLKDNILVSQNCPPYSRGRCVLRGTQEGSQRVYSTVTLQPFASIIQPPQLTASMAAGHPYHTILVLPSQLSIHHSPTQRDRDYVDKN